VFAVSLYGQKNSVNCFKIAHQWWPIIYLYYRRVFYRYSA